MTSTPETQNPILIIGAGISGLTLAQACKKRKIPYRIFERDASATHRSAGWGLTLHWSLEAFLSLIPHDIRDRLPETYVNKEAVDAGEKGSFTFFDLSTGEARWQVPAAPRIRVSRERLRKLMLTGLEVEWSKTLVEIKDHANGVVAVFSDGTEANGAVLVGCDGANSRVRQLCHPQQYENDQLPVRFIGAGVQYTADQVAGIQALDPYFLQGSDPRTDAFLWFSFLNIPSDPNSDEGSDDTYYCQVMTSWPYRAGFMGRDEATEIPDTKEEQLAWMKQMAKDWMEPFHSIVQNITPDSEIMPIHLADWTPRRNTAFDGRVVLIGDAAHAMVMYRGEGANHAIVDVSVLLQHLQPVLDNRDAINHDLKDAMEQYEAEMIERSSLGVLASRQACLDAHEYKRLNDQSPLVRRRLMRADLEALSS